MHVALVTRMPMPASYFFSLTVAQPSQCSGSFKRSCPRAHPEVKRRLQRGRAANAMTLTFTRWTSSRGSGDDCAVVPDKYVYRAMRRGWLDSLKRSHCSCKLLPAMKLGLLAVLIVALSVAFGAGASTQSVGSDLIGTAQAASLFATQSPCGDNSRPMTPCVPSCGGQFCCAPVVAIGAPTTMGPLTQFVSVTYRALSKRLVGWAIEPELSPPIHLA